MEALTTSLTTGFDGIVTDMLSLVGTVVPIALGLLGAVWAVKFAIKFFQNTTTKA